LDDNLNDDLQELASSLDVNGSATNFVQAIRSEVTDKSLAAYIKSPTNTVVVSTIQKFPFIKDVLKQNINKKYAVIIDEAHSSTNGEYLRAVKAVKD
jgi:type I restriction enzyme R subunit